MKRLTRTDYAKKDLYKYCCQIIPVSALDIQVNIIKCRKIKSRRKFDLVSSKSKFLKLGPIIFNLFSTLTLI